ncbi:Protein stn1 [Zalerion maritima]|uniref:Protein stn1 n=1 Tax=Zalerion maritima TaxID=339359 RepID=A0AAD5WR77_9PEZI|nr:Protein stn1 [Zalerion maritima]
MTDTAPEIYPQYCFSLSPTISTWAFLHASDIHQTLTSIPGFEGQNIYFYRTHPLKWIRVSGLVVAVDDYKERRIYTLDDSSGANIECVVRKPSPELEGATGPNGKKLPPIPRIPRPGGKREPVVTIPAPSNLLKDEEVDVGTILDIKGTISVFWERQITAVRMVILRTTEQEVDVWEKRNQFYEETLLKPWVLDPRVVEKLKRRAERGHKLVDKDKGTRRRQKALKGKADLGSGGVLVTKGTQEDEDDEEDHGDGESRRRERKIRSLANLGGPEVPKKSTLTIDAGTSNARRERKPWAVADLSEASLPQLPPGEDHVDGYSRGGRKKRTTADLGVSSEALVAVEVAGTEKPCDKPKHKKRPIADLGDVTVPAPTVQKSLERKRLGTDLGSNSGSSQPRDTNHSRRDRRKYRPVVDLESSEPTIVTRQRSNLLEVTADDGADLQRASSHARRQDDRRRNWHLAGLGHPASSMESETGPGPRNTYSALGARDGVEGRRERRRHLGKADLGDSQQIGHGFSSIQRPQPERNQWHSQRGADLGTTYGVADEERHRGRVQRPVADLGRVGDHRSCPQPSTECDTRRRRGALADLGQSQTVADVQSSSGATAARRPKRSMADRVLGQ